MSGEVAPEISETNIIEAFNGYGYHRAGKSLYRFDIAFNHCQDISCLCMDDRFAGPLLNPELEK